MLGLLPPVLVADSLWRKGALGLILRRHWFAKVWILFVAVFVVLHVSDPYGRSTDLTLELKSWCSYLFGPRRESGAC